MRGQNDGCCSLIADNLSPWLPRSAHPLQLSVQPQLKDLQTLTRTAQVEVCDLLINALQISFPAAAKVVPTEGQFSLRWTL